MSDVDPKTPGFDLYEDEEDEEGAYLRELEEGKRFSEYLKFSFEGVKTLEELDEALRSLADWILSKKAEGFVLERPVEEGRVEIISPDLLLS